MLNPAQFAIELALILAAFFVSQRIGGASHRRFVLGFAALAALLNLAFYGVAVWPIYMQAAAAQGIDPMVFRVTVAFETVRWGILALVLANLAVKLQDAGVPGGFVWLRDPGRLPQTIVIGAAVGVVAAAAMYGVSIVEQRLGVIEPNFWGGGSGNPGGALFAVGAGLRNLAGEEVLARLGVQALALYALRRVPGHAALAIITSSLVFEFWHNPFERPTFLNFAGSAVFGWAYQKRGYEAAAVGHCVADWIVIGVLPTLPFAG